MMLRAINCRDRPSLSGAIVAALFAALASTATASTSPDRSQASAPDGSHDFDFEVGAWTAHIRRLVHPLSRSTTWVEYDGPSVVRPIWGGRANLGELQVQGAAGRIEGLSLRLYNPKTRQWNISWANSGDGKLTPALTGGFHDGRGEFYDQETLDGRAIYCRFVFSNITSHAFSIEQAFSADGGKTWETNWIANFKR